MKFKLAARLFAAVLSAAVVVAVAMGVGAHINLNRDLLGYLNEQAVNRLELAVPSPGQGVVTGVLVALGDRVARGQELVTLAAAGGAVEA